MFLKDIDTELIKWFMRFLCQCPFKIMIVFLLSDFKFREKESIGIWCPQIIPRVDAGKEKY